MDSVVDTEHPVDRDGALSRCSEYADDEYESDGEISSSFEPPQDPLSLNAPTATHSNESLQDQVPKRRRGRPPKPKPLEPIVKRPQGRPRKHSPASQATGNALLPKRSRGRPRKVQPQTNESEGPSVPKRGRGRPRKYPRDETPPRVSQTRRREALTRTEISLATTTIPGVNVNCRLAPVFAAEHIPAVPAMASTASSFVPPSTQQPEVEEYIIPNANPATRVDRAPSEDNEEDDDGGEEVDDPDDASLPPVGDEDDDHPSSLGARPPPPWLMELFEAHITVIRGTSKERGAGTARRSIYDQTQSFWLPRRSDNPFFLLRVPIITPWLIYNPRFFYWDPLLLVDRIACPCITGASHGQYRHATPCTGRLTRYGYWKRPRRIVDLEDCFWLIGVRYLCNECNTTFQSWDQRVREKLPGHLAVEFPAHLTHRSGMSAAVFALLRC
ncbi:hypothetical protein BDZ89DRAFT_1147679 [Hymenopellis radicata]|nr:hypothetical protein BDZ89DRAFT_1147679 [Hymenopellis radicata]